MSLFAITMIQHGVISGRQSPFTKHDAVAMIKQSCSKHAAVTARRRGMFHVVAGERRSANRTTWTTGRGRDLAVLDSVERIPEHTNDDTLQPTDDDAPSVRQSFS